MEVGSSDWRLWAKIMLQARMVFSGSIKECLSVHFCRVRKEIFGEFKLVFGS